MCLFHFCRHLLCSRDGHYGGRYGHVQNVLPSRCETSFIPRLHEEEKRVKLFEFKSKQALGVQDFMT